MENAVPWSPSLVEELLYRQFLKQEDVSSIVPPAPKAASHNYMKGYEQATKVLFAYVRNGPAAALSSQNVNTAKQPLGRTPNSKVMEPPMRGYARTPTSNSIKLSSRDPSVPKTGMSTPVQRTKRSRVVEWPAEVPTNAMLKSNSRSKVAHLTARRVQAQEGVDPDLIFSQNPGELPLADIFAQFPKALKAVAAGRNASGDWRADTFTNEEEQLYKHELGFTTCGPTQCSYPTYLQS